MSYTLIWSPGARHGMYNARRNDPAGFQTLRATVNALAEDPTPEESWLVATGLRRIRIGRYGVLYRVDDDARAIEIHMIGQR